MSVALDFPEIDCLIDDPLAPSRPLGAARSLEQLPPHRPRRPSAPRRKSAASAHRKRAGSRKWTPEERAKEARRRRVVYAVVGMFLFILFSCVLVVIVTLTHHRTIMVDKDLVRKENEELMNSLAHDSTNHDSLQNLTASVPVDLK